MNLFEKIADELVEKEIVKAGDIGVLGLSGGGDSVALFWVLKAISERINFEFTAVHVHHGIRGESADRDMAFSEKLCSDNQVPFVKICEDVPELAENQGISTELAGRLARREAFAKIMTERGAKKLFLAHHANDQEETILMNFLRGSGLAGLSGMKMIQKNHWDRLEFETIRPLLNTEHSEIIEALKNDNRQWCEDETNAEEIYTRNMLRLKLIPQIKKLYPAFTTVMTRTGTIMSEDSDYIIASAREFLDKFSRFENGELKVSVGALRSAHIALAREVVRQAVLRTGGLVDVTYAQDEAILSLLDHQSGKCVNIEGGRTVRRSFGYLVFGEADDTVNNSELAFERCSQSAEEVLENIKNHQHKGYAKWMDCDKIARKTSGEILVRTPVEGDYLIIDHHGHTKKLSVYLKQQKLDAKKRATISVVAAGSLILAVDGMRDSCGFEIDKDSTDIIRIYSKEKG